MTQLHAGGKFDQNSYKVSGGLHGVGVSVVNALSTWLKLHDLARRQRALHGVPRRRCRRRSRSPATPAASAAPRSPSCLAKTTFTMTEFDFATLEHRLRELAFLNSGVTIVLSDMRHAVEKREEMRIRGRRRGIREISRPQQERADPHADHAQVGARRRHRRVRADLERQLSRDRSVLHQQHPAARRRHPSRRLPRRADPPGHQLCRDRSAAHAEGKGRR